MIALQYVDKFMHNLQRYYQTMSNRGSQFTKKQIRYEPIKCTVKSSLPSNPVQQNEIQYAPTLSIDDIRILQLRINELEQKEEIYIQKLMRYQESIQRQYNQSIHLQQLYTELFTSYKAKQSQIKLLENKYRQEKLLLRQNNIKKHQSLQIHKENQQSNQEKQMKKNNQLQKNIHNLKTEIQLLKKSKIQLQEIKQLNTKLKEENKTLKDKLDQTDKQIKYLKSKEKLTQSRQSLENKFIEEFQEHHKQLNSHKEQSIKLQYENTYLKFRNQDLQNNRKKLEESVARKDKQIIRLRQDKLNLKRQSSASKLTASPTKTLESNRSRSNKKYSHLINNLQNDNRILREQLLQLKEKMSNRLSHFEERNYEGKNSFYCTEEEGNRSLPLDITPRQMDKVDQEYFSFSQDRRNEGLPDYPEELELEKLIQQNKENTPKNAE